MPEITDEQLAAYEAAVAAVATAKNEVTTLTAKVTELDTENQDLKTYKETAETEKLTEKERLEKERDDARNEALAAKADVEAKETELRKATVESKAQALGFANPKDALAFVDMAKLKKDLSNVEDLVKQVATERPYLLTNHKPTNGGPAAGGQFNPQSQTEQIEKDTKVKGFMEGMSSVAKRLTFRQ